MEVVVVSLRSADQPPEAREHRVLFVLFGAQVDPSPIMLTDTI